MTGSLHIIMGPMFSGKSSELIKIAKRNKVIGRHIIGIKHVIDNRYSSEETILNHDKNKMPADSVFIINSLDDIRKVDIDEYDNPIIIIEELQFYQNTFNNVIKFVEEWGLEVICAGLDGDYRRKPFGDVLQLIPYANKITKLTALCGKCADGTEAYFTKRVASSEETILVGSGDKYEAVCRKHYLE